jgi:hypothetical protein
MIPKYGKKHHGLGNRQIGGPKGEAFHLPIGTSMLDNPQIFSRFLGDEPIKKRKKKLNLGGTPHLMYTKMNRYLHS